MACQNRVQSKPPRSFVDEDGVFLNRKEAYDRAVQCGQIVADGGERCLTSEMLKP